MKKNLRFAGKNSIRVTLSSGKDATLVNGNVYKKSDFENGYLASLVAQGFLEEIEEEVTAESEITQEKEIKSEEVKSSEEEIKNTSTRRSNPNK